MTSQDFYLCLHFSLFNTNVLFGINRSALKSYKENYISKDSHHISHFLKKKKKSMHLFAKPLRTNRLFCVVLNYTKQSGNILCLGL